jgi:tRNA (cytidine32/uridine32-2'-O)-methyltransferase
MTGPPLRGSDRWPEQALLQRTQSANMRVFSGYLQMTTDKSLLTDALAQVRIVLVETSHPGNIGAAARAMKNMGLKNLTLVNPVAFPHADATSRASGADDILQRTRVVASLDEAIADCALVLGASARQRSLPWPILGPPDAARQALDVGAGGASVAFMFGREDSGLSNDELQRCHYHVQIPTVADFSSLNLAMAVQVLSYELRLYYLRVLEEGSDNTHLERMAGRMTSPLDKGWDVPLASVEEFEQFLAHLEAVLVEIEFHDPQRPRQLFQRLRRLFQRAHPDRMEINILRGILRNVQRKTTMSGSKVP